MKHRFRVLGRLDSAGGAKSGTVEIDRAAGIFSVRPLRRRRAYQLPLSTVADMVCRVIIVSETRDRLASRRARKRGRR